MRKTLLILLLFFFFLENISAAHIKGGFFTYEYLGPGINDPTALRYHITLTVYMICSASGGQISDPITFTIYDRTNDSQVGDVSVPLTNSYDLSKVHDEPCISDDQRKCYYKIIVYDLPSIELRPTAMGYSVSYQRCCRIAGIQNVVASGSVGNTFTINIPGTSSGANFPLNSSPMFLVNDTAVVCSGNYFEIPFAATDADGDSLSYQFCGAYVGGGLNGIPPAADSPAPDPASPPPYAGIPYAAPFNGSQPMGTGVTINPRTGLISGIAPVDGEYVVCVCVSEFRQGVLVAITRKELHIVVGLCAPIAATLAPSYITCDGYSWTFFNGGDQSLITSYNWSFGDPATGALDSANTATATHIFSDTGTYLVKLVVNRGDPCSDTGTTVMKVYPGFFPDFNAIGSCKSNPISFHDASVTNYGVVNSWSWNFGDLTTITDTSHIQMPSWSYSDTGTKNVTLIVTNSKGCVDTITKPISVIDKPPITLAFRDTLICVPDVVQLVASGTGNFTWSPLTSIANANTSTPTVNPVVTTTYHVQLDQTGCLNTDSVQVRVVSAVSLNARPDTTICLTDSLVLSVNSNALHYNWDPPATLNDPTIKNPVAKPTAPFTTYHVVANIGSCSAESWINVTTVPFPAANAGPDQTICYNKGALLNGSHNGTSFSWSPASSLINANTLTPTAMPPRTTQYILTVISDAGCPKPSSDTVLVTVLPKITPSATHDTMVIVNQPLQLNAEGGTNYRWIPATALNNPLIKDPIGIYGAGIDSIHYTVLVSDAAGCVDSAHVLVTVFKTTPYVFVPTGFTPNGDGLNDIVAPVLVGIKQVRYFRIYNRWGQLVFQTSINGKGWDGTIHGVPQGSNVYVWLVSAVDYLDKSIFLKGTVTLIR